MPDSIDGDPSESRPRVVVWDTLTEAIPWSYDVERDLLARRGVDLVVPATEADAREAVRDADVVLACGMRFLDARTIGTLGSCAGLLCYSIGMNQVDAEAASAAGIPVTNCPFCVDEVSDHAVTLLLALERRLLPMARQAEAGDWSLENDEFRSIRRLRGQTATIVGAGRIGRQVARKLRVFGFRTVAHDPLVASWEVGDPELPLLSLADALGQADAVVLCASLNPTSHGMINASTLALVKRGAFLVNIARGGLIDEATLADALRSGQIGAAGLDVRVDEPVRPEADPLAGAPNLLVTPHMAGGSIEARADLHWIAAEQAIRLLRAASRLPATGRVPAA